MRRHALLATAEEEDQRVECIDDITGKELPWSEVRQAGEQELKYVRDLGVYEKVDVREPIEKYQVAPADTKWIDTNEASEEEHMKLRSRIVSRELKSGDRPDLYAGTLVEGNNLYCSAPQSNILNHAHRRVLVRLPAEDRMLDSLD